MSKYDTYKIHNKEVRLQNYTKMVSIWYHSLNIPPPPIYNVQIGEVLF
jgi:hypothetical protein